MPRHKTKTDMFDRTYHFDFSFEGLQMPGKIGQSELHSSATVCDHRPELFETLHAADESRMPL